MKLLNIGKFDKVKPILSSLLIGVILNVPSKIINQLQLIIKYPYDKACIKINFVTVNNSST